MHTEFFPLLLGKGLSDDIIKMIEQNDKKIILYEEFTAIFRTLILSGLPNNIPKVQYDGNQTVFPISE